MRIGMKPQNRVSKFYSPQSGRATSIRKTRLVYDAAAFRYSHSASCGLCLISVQVLRCRQSAFCWALSAQPESAESCDACRYRTQSGHAAACILGW
jgi:hypothetical protein